MSMFEEVSERGLGWPVGLGLVVAMVSSGPKIVKAGRPLIKKAIKAYLVLQDKGKEMMAETGEKMQDLYAEAKHEYEQEEVLAKTEGEEAHVEHAEQAVAEGGKRKPRVHHEESGEN